MKLPLRFNTIFAKMLLLNIILIILATVIPQTVFVNYILKAYGEDTKQYNMKNAADIKNSVDHMILEKVMISPISIFPSCRRTTI